MTYDELKLEFNRPLFKRELVNTLGIKCCNCGTEENIDYHHIVPLKLGGTNNLSNIVPICAQCHKSAHNGQHMSRYRNNRNSGRKKIVNYALAEKHLDDYIHGVIGTSECKRRLGYSQGTHLSSMKIMKKYIRINGIEKYRNNIDVKIANGELHDGDEVGYILYTDGRKETIYYQKPEPELAAV